MRSAHRRVRGTFSVCRRRTSQHEKPRASLSHKYISVQHGDRIYIFSLKHGKWSQGVTMKLPAAKKADIAGHHADEAIIQPASSRSRRSRSSACSGVSVIGLNCRSSLRSGSGSAANKLF